MALILFFSLWLDSEVTFQDLDLDYVPSRDSAVVSSTGHLFVLDVYSGIVSRSGPDGRPVGVVGGKGNAPHEYTQVYKIFPMEGGTQVCLWDRMGSKVLIFDANGNFVKSASDPGIYDLRPVERGWACGSWLFAGGDKEPIRVLIAAPDFDRETVVLSWHPEDTDPMGRVVQRGSGTSSPSYPFNPTPDNPLMALSHDGKRLYVYQPGAHLRIHVVDIASAKSIGTIRREEKRVVFDEEWGKVRLKEIQESTASRGGTVKLVPRFPEYYPLVGMLLASGEGPLVIGKWTGGGKPFQMIALDDQGEEAILPYDPRHEAQILAVRGGFAWLGVDLAKDKPGVVKVPVGRIAATLEKYAVN